MPELFHRFLLIFIPMFAAMGIIDNVPIFISLTESLDRPAKKQVIRHSIITASLIVVIFILIGNWILKMLGITIADFMVGGGLLLVVLSIKILVGEEEVGRVLSGAGFVPLGTPLIAGPALLTMALLLVNLYGLPLTLLSFAICITLQAIVLYQAEWLVKLLGKGGAKAFAKIAAIVLAAIAVMLIRRGVFEIIKGT
ncbi:MAG: MarC family protein [Deltaproteobacteria bacterium]|nr:MarC family protein [Deltaproteobacteria bacterium]